MGNSEIVFFDVSHSILSTARYFGGAQVNGTTYKYCPIKDILVREDWQDVYSKVPWNVFLEAAKTGVKPEIPKTATKKRISKKLPSLFDEL